MVNNSKRMQMNEIVKTNIERYIADSNPQYAILISGTWGTGKTFFIKQWITQYMNKCHEEVQTEDERILSPIQVSLFGTSSIQDIYERVREALNPKLYKVFKWGTFVADKATKIITGCELFDDVDIPFEADMGIWKKSNKTSKGCHLLILDDLERSKVPIIEILGFIDMFLNLYHFHVIVVGDEKHFTQNQKDIYEQYKEKIFGSTFYIECDVESAVATFINESEQLSPIAGEFYQNNRELVIDLFCATGYGNLRTLRQTLHQFTFIYDELIAGGEVYKKEVFANYLAISMELHNNSSCDLEQQIKSLRYGMCSKDSDFSQVVSKYQFVEGKYQARIFRGFDFIVDAIKYGKLISDRINLEIEIRKNKSISEKYRLYPLMSNEEFMQNTKVLCDYLDNDIENLHEYLLLLYFYCKVQHEGLVKEDKIRIQKGLDKCVIYLRRAKTLNEFVLCESTVRLIISSVSYETQVDLFSNIGEALLNVVLEQKKILKDDLTCIMEHLTNEKIDAFIQIISGSDPYKYSAYSMQPIFDKIDAEAFVKGYISLSNENKDIVRVYIENRYERLQKSNGILKDLSPDKDNLQVICDKLKEAEEQLKLIDKLQVNKFITMLENAIAKLNLVAEN